MTPSVSHVTYDSNNRLWLGLRLPPITENPNSIDPTNPLRFQMKRLCDEQKPLAEVPCRPFLDIQIAV